MLFIPLQKVDAVQRLVYGRLDETPDRSNDIFDYASSKPNFERWSKAMAKASGGRNLGNIRAMHGLKAAGKLTQINFDDTNKSIELCAQIVDDDEWAKVEAGVYTGFSPGGKFARRWQDGTYTRYTGIPHEISIVDVPANPGATFTMVKADGDITIITFPEKSEDSSSPEDDEDEADPDAEAEDAEAEEGEDEDGEAAAAANKTVQAPLPDPLASLRRQMTKIAGENASLKKRVAALEALPAPGGPVLRTVEKGGDRNQEITSRYQAIEAMENGPAKATALIRFQMDGK